MKTSPILNKPTGEPIIIDREHTNSVIRILVGIHKEDVMYYVGTHARDGDIIIQPRNGVIVAIDKNNNFCPIAPGTNHYARIKQEVYAAHRLAYILTDWADS